MNDDDMLETTFSFQTHGDAPAGAAGLRMSSLVSGTMPEGECLSVPHLQKILRFRHRFG